MTPQPSPHPPLPPQPSLRPAGRSVPSDPGPDDLAALVRPRLGTGTEGSLWAALLERGRLRLVVPLREHAPAPCDEDAEDRALLALLDAVGVADVALVVPRWTGRADREDRRLWRRARSGAVGLQVRLLGLLVVGDQRSEWAS